MATQEDYPDPAYFLRAPPPPERRAPPPEPRVPTYAEWFAKLYALGA